MMHKLGALMVLLAAIGAINWGLVGALNFDLVKYLGELVKSPENFARVVYVIVGIAGLYALVDVFMCNK